MSRAARQTPPRHRATTAHATQREAGTPMARSRARLALFACCFSLFMAQLDATAVNVALPSVGRSLGGGVGGLQWVVDAYVLVLASLAMSGGGIGDRYGRRRTYRAGLSVFSLGSLGCSLAPALPFLVAARMLQAAGAAMLMPVTLSIITSMLRDPASRARAIGVWIGAAGLAAGIGPLAGGALTSGVGWRAIFWINLPIGAIALALTGPLIPESRAARPRRAGLGGQALLVLTLAALTYALIQAPQYGWHSPPTLALLAVAAAAGLAQHRGARRASGLLHAPVAEVASGGDMLPGRLAVPVMPASGRQLTEGVAAIRAASAVPGAVR